MFRPAHCSLYLLCSQGRERKKLIPFFPFPCNIMESSIEVPWKIKNSTTVWSSNSTPGYLSNKNENTDLKRYMNSCVHCGISWWLGGNESACQYRSQCSISGPGRSPGDGTGHPLQYSCLGKSHDQRSLAGYSTWGHKRVGHNLATKQQQHVHCSIIYNCQCMEATQVSTEWIDEEVVGIHWCCSG